MQALEAPRPPLVQSTVLQLPVAVQAACVSRAAALA